MSIVKNIKLADHGKQKIEWVKNFMPALTRIGEELAETQAFAGLKIGMSIHMEAKTAYLATILRNAGAEVFATGCNPLSTQDDVASALATEKNIEVYAIHDVEEATYWGHINAVLDHHPDLIIDDGGDLMESYLKRPEAEHWHIIGGCEETTTGIHRLKQLEHKGKLPFPMVDVNDANCKHLFDNRYGTGQSAWDAIMHNTNVLVAGKVVVVAGYGWCGRGIAMRAKGMGAKVIVCEVNPVKALEAIMDGYKVMPMAKAAELADFIITATGCKDVVDYSKFYKMRNNVFLANAGHFNVEINLEQLAQMSKSVSGRRDNITGYQLENGRTINVLAEGRLVNLASGNGHPAEIMDMSFSLQALGLEYLLNHRDELEKKVYDVPKDIDDYVAWVKLEALDAEIDYLTPDQLAYLSND